MAATYEQRSDAHFVGSQKPVTPAQAGVHNHAACLDSRFRGNDTIIWSPTYYDFIKVCILTSFVSENVIPWIDLPASRPSLNKEAIGVSALCCMA